MTHCFHSPEVWSGGTIDTLMFFGPRPVSDAIAVAETLWTYSRLQGPFRHRNVDPKLQLRMTAFEFNEEGCEQLIGTYQHSSGIVLPFVHTTIRDEEGLWVYAGIPLGAMPPEWDVGAYPFYDGKPIAWLPPLIEELRMITAFVDSTHNVRAATYGWVDISGTDVIVKAIAGQIPNERWNPIEIWSDHNAEYFPMTVIEAQLRSLPCLGG